MTDDLLDGDEDESADDSGSEESESDADEKSKSSDKRIRDLQSAKDKETARANKAESENQRLRAALTSGDAGAGAPPAGGAAADEQVLDMARMFVYQQHPKLEEYGIAATDLTGSSPTEIAQSAAAAVARLDKLETKARNKVLADNGMAPEVYGGNPPPPPRDYSKMSKEEFDKVLAEHGVKV